MDKPPTFPSQLSTENSMRTLGVSSNLIGSLFLAIKQSNEAEYDVKNYKRKMLTLRLKAEQKRLNISSEVE